MLSQETIEKLADYLVQRVEETNTDILIEIAKTLKKVKNLTPSEAQKLINIFKYGGDYKKIKKKLAELSKLNQKDIDKIFKEVAKRDSDFMKQFYDYRGKQYIPYEKNKALQRQVKAIETITKGNYQNFTSTIGYTLIKNGQKVFTPLSRAYEECIDRAILSVIQGKSAVNDEINKIVKELASSGLKVINYDSTYIGKDGKTHYYTRRLDSAVRMNVLDGVRMLQNNINQQFGQEFDYDGVEISVHEAPAPDHALVQGRQFNIEQFNNFQNDKRSEDITGRVFEAEFEGHDRRAISQYNCYHNAFPIIIGVSTPQYTDEELDAIIKRNNEGFTYKGKHYTMYEGTQLQRQLEAKIREAKDTQIMANELDADTAVLEAQQKIALLNKEYKNLCNASNLTPRKERMRVSGYKRRSVK